MATSTADARRVGGCAGARWRCGDRASGESARAGCVCARGRCALELLGKASGAGCARARGRCCNGSGGLVRRRVRLRGVVACGMPVIVSAGPHASCVRAAVGRPGVLAKRRGRRQVVALQRARR